MNLIQHNTIYKKWLTELKQKIRTVQLKAAVTVNSEMLQFYWELGAEIVEKQINAKWGDGFIKQLSTDLMAEFDGIKGFSERNLKYIRQWYFFYYEILIGKQAVAQLTKIPWGHNLAIIAKCKNVVEALYYVQNTMTYGWSRSVLVHQIESKLFEREGKAVTNFQNALPPKQSDLVLQTLKDPYVFDFMAMTKEYNEHDLEKNLIDHISSFLLELGAGFAYLGHQVPLQVGEKEFFIDLLFYHSRLHCYIVIELKTIDFEPEHTGKLNFYIKAVDEKLRQDGDNPTIGIILCKSKDKLVAEYALSDIHKPIGISEYQLTQSLPENLKSSLPSIEDIEAELMGENKKEG
jgi:predicted nuclease of restriction endonuclease-like (RecB) superfamily